MNDIDRRVIQLHLDTLAIDADFIELLTNLSEKKDIITHNLKEKYNKLKESGSSNSTLNRELFGDIQARGQHAFDILIQCLQKTKPHLAELLKPNERISNPTCDYGEKISINEKEVAEFQGICTVYGNDKNGAEIINAVKKLCRSIKAKYVSSDENLAEASFHLAIKVDGMFLEEDIKNIESLYTDCGNLKIIIINIICKTPDNADRNPSAKMSSGGNSAAVFIVNIHIHQGDHVASVINIIKEVVANNPDNEIRAIFCMVMEKLSKWCCRLNTESRSFPEFRF